jgi:membrane fusion protein (multidrug efflux system)
MAERALKSVPYARQEAPDVREAPPVVPIEDAPEVARDALPADTKEPRSRRSWIRGGSFGLLPLALIAGCYWYVVGGQLMSTDDAYVEADTVGISTDVPGIVKSIEATNNQHVEPGQILYRLNPQQFQIALDNAEANLAQTALSVEAMKQDYQRMLSDAAAQQGQVALDQVTYDRDATLLPSGTASKATYDQARYTLETDGNKLESLRRQAAVQLARLAGDADIPVTQHPQYLQAKAQVDEAKRQLDHTVVRAPFAGTVTNVPSIAPGKYLAASTTSFYLVDRDHVWIDATPKETELTYVEPGQSVTVTVDTYPDARWAALLRASARRRRSSFRYCRRRTPAAIG